MIERLEHTDMGHAPRAAASEYESEGFVVHDSSFRTKG